MVKIAKYLRILDTLKAELVFVLFFLVFVKKCELKYPFGIKHPFLTLFFYLNCDIFQLCNISLYIKGRHLSQTSLCHIYTHLLYNIMGFY